GVGDEEAAGQRLATRWCHRECSSGRWRSRYATRERGARRAPRSSYLWLLLLLLAFDAGDDEVRACLVDVAGVLAADVSGEGDDVPSFGFDDDGAVALAGVVAVVGDVCGPGGAERLAVQEDAGHPVVCDLVAASGVAAEVEELGGAFDAVQAGFFDGDRIDEFGVVRCRPAIPESRAVHVLHPQLER